MKNFSASLGVLAMGIVLGLAFSGRVSAQSFTSSDSGAFAQTVYNVTPASQTTGGPAYDQFGDINLNTAGTDWIYYIYGGEAVQSSSSYVVGGNSGFNPVLTFGTSPTTLGWMTGYQGGNYGADGNPNVTYTNGYQYNYTAAGVPSAIGTGTGDDSKNPETIFSLTPSDPVAKETISSSIQLSGATETLSFMLYERNTALDMSFTLDNSGGTQIGTYSVLDALPAGATNTDNWGTFNLNISGAAQGDILDWTESADAASANGNPQIGIEYITAPEPSTYAMVALGAGALVMLARFRRRVP